MLRKDFISVMEQPVWIAVLLVSCWGECVSTQPCQCDNKQCDPCLWRTSSWIIHDDNSYAFFDSENYTIGTITNWFKSSSSGSNFCFRFKFYFQSDSVNDQLAVEFRQSDGAVESTVWRIAGPDTITWTDAEVPIQLKLSFGITIRAKCGIYSQPKIYVRLRNLSLDNFCRVKPSLAFPSVTTTPWTPVFPATATPATASVSTPSSNTAPQTSSSFTQMTRGTEDKRSSGPPDVSSSSHTVPTSRTADQTGSGAMIVIIIVCVVAAVVVVLGIILGCYVYRKRVVRFKRRTDNGTGQSASRDRAVRLHQETHRLNPTYQAYLTPSQSQENKASESSGTPPVDFHNVLQGAHRSQNVELQPVEPVRKVQIPGEIEMSKCGPQPEVLVRNPYEFEDGLQPEMQEKNPYEFDGDVEFTHSQEPLSYADEYHGLNFHGQPRLSRQSKPLRITPTHHINKHVGPSADSSCSFETNPTSVYSHLGEEQRSGPPPPDKNSEYHHSDPDPLSSCSDQTNSIYHELEWVPDDNVTVSRNEQHAHRDVSEDYNVLDFDGKVLAVENKWRGQPLYSHLSEVQNNPKVVVRSHSGAAVGDVSEDYNVLDFGGKDLAVENRQCGQEIYNRLDEVDDDNYSVADRSQRRAVVSDEYSHIQ